MKIGIDISQSVYEGTGVGEYTRRLVEYLLARDQKNEYILFFSNRNKYTASDFGFLSNTHTNYQLKIFRIPVKLLEFLWNKIHILPIEWLIGDIDVFLTSDWMEPPTVRAQKVTTLHDLSVLRFPDSYDEKIKTVHARKLKWVQKESAMIMCDSNATKQDAIDLLGIAESKLRVVYLGLS